MSFWPVRIRPIRLLVLLNVLLAAGLAWLWFDEHAQVRNFAWSAPKALPPGIKLPAVVSPSDSGGADPVALAAILERPIFAPDRRQPPPPAPPAPPPPPDPLADIQIRGIFTGASAGILARVDGKLRRVKVNEAVGAWTLKAIEGRSITFARGDENRKLQLSYARLDAPVAPTAPPAVANARAVPAPIPAASAAGVPQNAQDETRERLRRRNELRASRGLPPVND
jgi:hypothetical protein